MSESSSEQQQSTANTDNRRVIGERGISAESSTVQITALDGQVANAAITASTDDLKAALNYSDHVTGRAFDFAAGAQNTALDSLNREAALINTAYADAKGRGALTDKILIGSLVMAGLVALAALRKG
ncbi:MAG: hypothetical protein V4609_13305 [Pseudomonadota bacterium]